jgi:hypothetical protein
VLLVADRRPPSSDLAQVAVRRFRLARLPGQARVAAVVPNRPVKPT